MARQDDPSPILRLPNELLLQIMSLVLMLPRWSALNMTWNEPTSHLAFIAYVKNASALSRVCRRFRPLAVPFLYTHIFGQNPGTFRVLLEKQLMALHDVLARRPMLRRYCRALYLEVCIYPRYFEIARDLITWLTETRVLYWYTREYKDERVWEMFQDAVTRMPDLERISYFAAGPREISKMAKVLATAKSLKEIAFFCPFRSKVGVWDPSYVS
ncbi:hypothetical protein QBC47DRAFT_431288 [Echria macrotheca]|uniref:F-box domain-containing protein n=1 Tax=Echria macrotheca TaxID=438768 RepID=A0AAJ0F9C4_9PEZI|nr:hypothetical protein QBC47DRAFT_431288 [Echria macrotheca]